MTVTDSTGFYQFVDLPAGDYFVQAVLHRYDNFERGDGHTVWLPASWEAGQQWNREPGNLYSTPRKIKLDPSKAGRIEIELADDCQDLPREGLIDLDEIQILERQTGVGQGHARGLLGQVERRLATHQRLLVTISVARGVDVADGHDLHVVVAHEELHVGNAPRTRADHADMDPVAGRAAGHPWLLSEYSRRCFVRHRHRPDSERTELRLAHRLRDADGAGHGRIPPGRVQGHRLHRLVDLFDQKGRNQVCEQRPRADDDGVSLLQLFDHLWETGPVRDFLSFANPVSYVII